VLRGRAVGAGAWLEPVRRLPRLPRCSPSAALPAARDPPPRLPGGEPFPWGFTNQTQTSAQSQGSVTGTVQAPAPRGAFQPGPAEGLGGEGGVGGGCTPCLLPVAALRPLSRLAMEIRAGWPGRGGGRGTGAEIRHYQAAHTRIPLVREGETPREFLFNAACLEQELFQFDKFICWDKFAGGLRL